MLIQYNRIDANGMYVEPVLFEEGQTINEFGDILDDQNIIAGNVPQGFNHPKWDVMQWVEGSEFDLVAYKTSKIESLYTLCNEAVLGIFTSSALGISHDYIFDYEAQMNLAGTKQAFDSALVTSVEWNTRDAGVLVHDASQFNQLWLDGFLHKISTINKYRSLKGQVESAVDKVEVDSIVW